MSTLPIATGRQTFTGTARSVRRHCGEAVRAAIWTLLASAGVVVVPLLLGRLVDAVRRDHRGDLMPLLLLIGTGTVLGALFSALAQRSTGRLGAYVAADLRERVLDRTLSLPAQVLETAGGGDLTSRVTEDVETFVDAVPMVTAVSSASATVLVSAAAVTTLDWRLTLAFLVVLPIYWAGLSRYLPRAGPVYAAERRLAAERGRVLLETLHGLPTVRAYDMAAVQTRRVAAASQQSLTRRLQAVWLSLWLSKSMNAAEAAGLSAIFLTGAWLVRGDVVTVGAVTAAALLFHRLFDPLGTLLGSFDDVQRAGAALARIIGVTLAPVPRTRPGRGPLGPVSLRAEGIRHSYDGTEDVVHAIDLVVPAGTTLAIVGTSGAGKTTLASILAGMFPATAGRTLLIDGPVDGSTGADEPRTAVAADLGSSPARAADPGSGTAGAGEVDVADLEAGRLRDWIGMVAQETHVFAGTLRDDVSLAAPGSTDEQLQAALTLVGAQKWIALLPAGLDTRIGAGGYPLTSVQIQQLALSRLALRDPPVIVLDEATAEAGSAGARDLEDAATALLAGRTAIVVAHRLSQARTCDRIAVMNHGRIEEFGTHDSLLQRGGRYAGLWSAWSTR
jgi:ATP-binding cassette subfamily C protein